MRTIASLIATLHMFTPNPDNLPMMEQFAVGQVRDITQVFVGVLTSEEVETPIPVRVFVGLIGPVDESQIVVAYCPALLSTPEQITGFLREFAHWIVAETVDQPEVR